MNGKLMAAEKNYFTADRMTRLSTLVEQLVAFIEIFLLNVYCILSVWYIAIHSVERCHHNWLECSVRCGVLFCSFSFLANFLCILY